MRVGALPALAYNGARNAKVGDWTPRYYIKDKGCNRKLTDEELNAISLLLKRMNIDEFVLMPNIQPNYPTIYPPTGYVATVHQDAAFRYDFVAGLRTLFRGVARCRVSLASDHIGDADRRRMRRALNLFIRDVSPIPPLWLADKAPNSTEDSGWVASLGPAGWIGLYRGRKQDPHNLVAVVDTEYYLVVCAGLDEKTYDNMERYMMGQSSQESGISMQAMFGTGGALNPWRKLAAENRRRLLAMAEPGDALAVIARWPTHWPLARWRGP